MGPDKHREVSQAFYHTGDTRSPCASYPGRLRNRSHDNRTGPPDLSRLGSLLSVAAAASISRRGRGILPMGSVGVVILGPPCCGFGRLSLALLVRVSPAGRGPRSWGRCPETASSGDFHAPLLR